MCDMDVVPPAERIRAALAGPTDDPILPRRGRCPDSASGIDVPRENRPRSRLTKERDR
jgi:hypothetical protein